MSKGGRVNEQDHSHNHRDNDPLPVDYVPPGTGSTISREPVQPNYNAPQQGFNGSPGKGMRPQPYGGGFGGGFGGYQTSPYSGGFGGYQPSPYGGGFGGYQQPSYGGFGGYQQSPYEAGFSGRAFNQGYGMQGGIGSLLSNYPSYMPPRMPFNPYMR